MELFKLKIMAIHESKYAKTGGTINHKYNIPHVG